MQDNINVKPASTRKVGVKFGLISAGIGVFIFLVLTLTGMNAFDNKWSFLHVAIGVILIILGHKEFKQSGDGFMSYGQGVAIGFWMALVSVVIGGLFTWIYTAFIEPTAMEPVYEMQRMKFEEQGMPDSQIETSMEWMKKLFWPIYFFFGIFFSVLIAVIVSIFTQKKNPQPVF